MKTIVRIFSFIPVSFILLIGCTKSLSYNSNSGPSTTATVNTTQHPLGVLPPNPAHYAIVPVLSAEEIIKKTNTPELFSVSEPASYLLKTPPIRDQEQIGSCTGFCGTEANEILRYYANGSFPSTLSPLYLYYAERVKINGNSITSDDGAEMVDIPIALQKYGECIESDYAYPTNSAQSATASSIAYTTPPTATAVSNALNYKIGKKISSFAMVKQGDTATVISLLRNNIPVMVGFNVYDNSNYNYFFGLNTTSYTYNPLTSKGNIASGLTLYGSHANIIYGYNNTLKVFYMENSWGTGWGNNGYWLLPYSVFMNQNIVPTGNVFWMTLN